MTLIIQEVCHTQSVVSATLRQSLSILSYLSSAVGPKQVGQASQSAPTLALKSPSTFSVRHLGHRFTQIEPRKTGGFPPELSINLEPRC